MILKSKIKIILSYFAILLSFYGCSYYSFSGGSIPKYIKSCQVVLFEDNSGRYDLNLSEILTEKVKKQIEDYDLLELDESAKADSRIFCTITSYKDKIISHSASEVADQKIMELKVKLNFVDNIKNKSIIKNAVISKDREYSQSDSEDKKKELFEQLLDELADDIVIKLSSNW